MYSLHTNLIIYNNSAVLDHNMKAICKLEKETEIHVFPVVKSVFEVKE